MRILVLSDSFPPHNMGGAGEVADLVSRGLAAREHEVTVLCGVARRRDAGTARRGGLTVQCVWLPVPNPLRLHLSVLHPLGALAVARVARAMKPDVVHAHNVHERLSFASLVAVRAPLVLTAHDYLLFCLTKFLCSRGDVTYPATPHACPHCRHIRRAPGRNTVVHSIVRRNVSAVACISHAQRTALRVNGFSDVRMEVVYNGLDPATCAAPAERVRTFRARHGLDHRPLVLFGGRISGAKGGDQLLRSMAEARKQIDCQLAILGDREAYFAHARRLADEVGLDRDALKTIGWLEGEELQRAFATADVCATPSVYPDPFNLMTLRAMGHAKPVVGTCYGATPEIVLDGETGLIADPWQPEQFGARLAQLLVDQETAQRLGAAGRERMQRHFTLDQQVTHYESLLASVAA